jgi:hypothetical protein
MITPRASICAVKSDSLDSYCIEKAPNLGAFLIVRMHSARRHLPYRR